jgi:very-short-patch-repair endonuclease
VPQLSASLAATVRRQHGVVTVAQLIGDGIGRNSIRRLVEQGTIVRYHHGVYRVATSPDLFEARCVAACLCDPTTVVTGVAAGRLLEFRHVFKPDEPVLLVEHDRSPLSRGVTLRRTNVLEPKDWCLRDDGIRLATPARAWFDCARDTSDQRFEMLTEWVIDRHSSVPEIWEMMRRMSARGRPGAARVRRVLSQRSAWQRPAGSGLELRVLNALERAGIRGLVRQYAIKLPNGIVIHADGALPSIRWAVEVDHVTWHGGRLDAQRDKGRDRQLRRINWQVDRVTDVELRERFERTIRELVELVMLRRARAA